MAVKTRQELIADIPAFIKSHGAVSPNKTTGEGLRELIKNIVDTMLIGGQGVPVGAIMLWSGTVNDIPRYWRLCDGTNGTPNLVDKFVRGRGANTPQSTFSGGSDSVAILEENMPVHNHSVSVTIPAHSHKMFTPDFMGGNSPAVDSYPERGTAFRYGSNDSSYLMISSNRIPTLAATSPAAATTSSSITSNKGGSLPIKIIPTYYSLAYIQFMGTGVEADVIPPSKPVVNAVAYSNRIDITWTSSYDASGISEYRIYLDGIYQGTVGNSNSGYSINMAVEVGRTYQVNVMAVDNSGLYTSSDPANATFIPVVPVPALANDAARRTTSSLTLNILYLVGTTQYMDHIELWIMNQLGGVSSVYYTSASGVLPSEYTISNLLDNTVYYFKVRAISAFGTASEFSPTISAVTRPIQLTTTTTTTISPNCPVEGTLVTLSDGTQTEVENLIKGQELLSAKIDTFIDSEDSEVFNWSNSKLRVRDAVSRVHSIEPHSCNSVVSINDGLIEFSDSHTQLVRRDGYWKFMLISSVKLGDFIHIKGKHIEITKIDHNKVDERTVYKLVLESPHHLFYTNGVLTHNPVNPNTGLKIEPVGPDDN